MVRLCSRRAPAAGCDPPKVASKPGAAGQCREVGPLEPNGALQRFRCQQRANIPDDLVEGPFEDFDIAGDVYSTAYLIARNATPDMYSINPLRNREVRVVWLYLLFIVGSQIFVLTVITLVYPPAAERETVIVDCGNATAVAALHARGFLPSANAAACRNAGPLAFEADVRGTPAAFHTVEHSVAFYDAILTKGGPAVCVLRFICCIWVFSHMYLQEFDNVRSLLQYHDFSRWFLPIKGEKVRNSWTICIPIVQFAVVLAVTSVSFLTICAHSEPFDIVMNSLAFTFIAEVGGFFNEPLARKMGSTRVSSAPPSYGVMNYLYPEYRLSNSISEDGTYTDGGWYICEDEEKAGLLCDYKVRHNPDKYPHTSEPIVQLMERMLFVVPVSLVLLGALRCGSLPMWAGPGGGEL